MRTLTTLATLLVVLIAAPAARADFDILGDAPIPGQFDGTITATGELTATLHPDPATCAHFDRCSIDTVTMRWVVPSTGRIKLLRLAKGGVYGATTETEIDARNGTTVTRAGQTSCTDRAISGDGTLASKVVGSAIRFTVRPRQALAPSRCGGLLASDLPARLGHVAVPFAQLRKQAQTADLAGSAPVTAGGLTGTVTSTIKLQFAPLRRTPLPRTRYRPGKGLTELAVHYKIVRVTGSVPVTVRADPHSCKAVDSCGVDGRLTFTPGPASGHLEALASGTAARDDLAKALGLHTLADRFFTGGDGQLRGAEGSLVARYRRAGRPACTDRVALTDGLLSLQFHARAITVGYATTSGATHCPGPVGQLGDYIALGGTHLTPTALRARRLVLHLTQPVRSTERGYRLQTRPDVTIVLRRSRVRLTVLR